jgi:hypothetical protein
VVIDLGGVEKRRQNHIEGEMEKRRSGISEESAHGLALYGPTTASARRCGNGGRADKEGQRGGGGGQGSSCDLGFVNGHTK